MLWQKILLLSKICIYIVNTIKKECMFMNLKMSLSNILGGHIQDDGASGEQLWWRPFQS